MKKFLRGLAAAAQAALLVTGLAVIAWGVYLLLPAAGVICAGVEIAGLALVLIAGTDPGDGNT